MGKRMQLAIALVGIVAIAALLVGIYRASTPQADTSELDKALERLREAQ